MSDHMLLHTVQHLDEYIEILKKKSHNIQIIHPPVDMTGPNQVIKDLQLATQKIQKQFGQNITNFEKNALQQVNTMSKKVELIESALPKK